VALGTPISDHQRRIVLRLLEQIGAAGDAYREQLDGATVVPGCRCGCPTFEFDALGGSPAPPPYPSTVLADGYAKSGDGHSLGVLLFVRDGRLSELEFYGYEPIEPFDLPALDTVWIWGTGPGPPMNRG
jgi:hypothetical protein